MEQKEKEILKILQEPFDVVLKYFSEKLKSNEKPLGEKIQTKVREKLHPILSPLSSWVADNVLKYFDENTSQDCLKEKNEKGTLHFISQAKGYVEKISNNLKSQIEKTNPEKAPKAKPTVFAGISSILERGKAATQTLSVSTAEKFKCAKNEKAI